MRFVPVLLALVVGATLAGCIGGGVRPIMQFYLEPEAHPPVLDADGPTLAVRPLRAPRIYRQKIVYRDADFVLGQYDLNEWSEAPADILTRVIMEALRATGQFSDVAFSADLTRSDAILTGEIRAFEEDRTQSPWHARCEVRLELRVGGADRTLAWAETLTVHAPMARNHVETLPEAMNRALDALAAEITAAVSELDLPASR